MKSLKDSASNFVRWKQGTCICYDQDTDNISPEDMSNYTFLRDINENQTIKLISVELSELKK